MRNTLSKSALVVEGGGMRGVFASGVLNEFGRQGFDPFDLYIGVSAGACNLASHLAGQNERNYYVTLTYSATSQFINLPRFLLGGHYLDLDWLWNSTIKEYRLDLKSLFKGLQMQKKEYLIVVTSMKTGCAFYLKPSEDTLEHYLKASSSIPVLYRNILKIGPEEVTDGGIADSIPVLEAYRRGAANITIIRSRPEHYEKKQHAFSFLFPMFFKRYPRLIEAFKKRDKTYMEAVRFIRNPPQGIRVSEIAPPRDLTLKRVTRDITILKEAYQTGIVCGRQHIEKIKTFI
jgi:predicted patatin/cPLA2 family phospholipase